MMSALTVIPSIIGIIGSLSTVTASWTAIQGAAATATEVLGTAMDFLCANPIVLVIAGIAAIAIGLYEAYEHCGPFRDAVNEIASVLGGALAAAATAVYNALNWLWNNVLVPLGQFLGAVFNMYLQSWIATWNILKAAVDDVYDGLNWLWNNILKPLATFIGNVLLAEWNAFASGLSWAYNNLIKPVFDALEKVYNEVLKPIGDILGTISGGLGSVGKAISGGLGSVGKMLGLATGGVVTGPTVAMVGEDGPEAVIPLDENVGDVLDDISGGSAVGQSTSNSTVNQGDSNQTITIQMTTNPQISIGQLSGTASLTDIINAVTSAVNNGMAQPLIDAINAALAEKVRRRR